MSHLLLTGATGHVGKALLPRLLSNPDLTVLALIRARDENHLAERKSKLITQLDGAAWSDRLTALRGDVSSPNLGLSPTDRDMVRSTATSILHSAASVRFDMPAESAAEQNIRSTENILSLAVELAEAGRLERHDHISTCYVAGDRKGRVFEHECDEGQGFRNSYEWSKCRSEVSVRAASDRGLPICIHRPSIVVGDSSSGSTESFNVLYWPLKLWARGWWRTFPGRPDVRGDIVPVDFVADAICRLRDKPESLGKCVHLAVGDAAPTAEQIVDRVRTIADLPPIRYVDQRFYKRYMRPFAKGVLIWTKRGRGIIRGGEAFMPYFEHNPVFDTTNRQSLLGAECAPPDPLDYFDTIVRYALAADFGRRPSAEAAA